MPELNDGVLKRLRQLDGKFRDNDFYPEQELRLYVWLHEHLFDEIVKIGGVETGYVFRQRGDMCLLVYKAKFDGVQRVVFLTAPTPVRCIKSLCRKFYADQLKWVDDKFA